VDNALRKSSDEIRYAHKTLRSIRKGKPLIDNEGESYFVSDGKGLNSKVLIVKHNEWTTEHYHPKYEELYVVLMGKALFKMNGFANMVKDLGMVIVPPNTKHKMYNPLEMETTILSVLNEDANTILVNDNK